MDVKEAYSKNAATLFNIMTEPALLPDVQSSDDHVDLTDVSPSKTDNRMESTSKETHDICVNPFNENISHLTNVSTNDNNETKIDVPSKPQNQAFKFQKTTKPHDTKEII